MSLHLLMQRPCHISDKARSRCCMCSVMICSYNIRLLSELQYFTSYCMSRTSNTDGEFDVESTERRKRMNKVNETKDKTKETVVAKRQKLQRII